MLMAAVLVSGFVRSALGQVNLPDGFEIVEFAESDTLTWSPRINNCGEIVYVQDRLENSRVYLYDNGKIARLTEADPGRGVFGPDINDAGTVVWARGLLGQPKTWEIVMLANGQRSMLGKGDSPSINGLGHMSWEVFQSYDCNIHNDIMYFDGATVERISRSELTDQVPQINDDDWITWGRQNFCVNPWVGQILLYSEGVPVVLPAEAAQAQAPTINNLGQIAWGTNELGIELWQNGQTRILAGTDSGKNPRLNNLGDIYYIHFDGPGGTLWDGYLYRVSGGAPTIHRLTEDTVWNIDGDINDWVEVVWHWTVGPHDEHGGIRFMRRIRTGDAEFDGDIDLVDHGAFAACITGPGRVDRLCDCRFVDIDCDGDVDLHDFAQFQNAFRGE
ncbi:MAG: hypothetical protein C4547_04670 [Phycisphaerales bacterium]|nr:MAG: hypothetical protein C4547_04670 [Phycisphaerales bacterium]